MEQEYPVVILQCRGTAASITPETCWTSSYGQRSQIARGEENAAWTEDLYADTADKEKLSGLLPVPADCADVPTGGTYYSHLTPFKAANGKVYAACDAAHMPPEAAVDSALPPAEMAAFTDADGNGHVEFEVRTDVENESLGCKKGVACAIVVVPVVGISCDQASTADDFSLTVAEKGCRKTGRFLPGSSNFLGTEVDQAVGASLWWAASNWRNRLVVPITIGDPPDTCDIMDRRPPTGFYGSELLGQAALQWAPAYCLDKRRFKFQLNKMPDEAGWSLMTSGGGAAAVVSSPHEAGADPVGYAPTGVTGFGIGYIVDRPGNSGEYTSLRLNARLIAKLLTLSYPGSSFGTGHPGLGANPWSIQADPEFIALNPGLSRQPTEAGAALLSLSNSSDIISQLTAYIAQDRDAKAFIDGKPDQWGMRVNPAYRKLRLPRADWPLLDDYIPEGRTECLKANPSIYLNNLAAPVTTLQKIADALIDGWPNTQTRCDTDLSSTPHTYKLGRRPRTDYPFGQRFLLGIVSLGDAARYGLRTASLQARKGSFVPATDASLGAALKLAEQQRRLGPFVLDQADVRASTRAYPGTMVVYTAARLRNLDKADATKVAQFIRVSTTEGQRQGSGNGQLPGGYLPITKKGVTARLFASARAVADAVEAQRPAKQTPASVAGPAPAALASVPSAPPVGAPPAPAATPVGSAPTAVVMAKTQTVGSDLGGGLLPVLVLLGLGAGLLSTLARVLLLPMWRRR
jgi:hypothetical protein